MSTDPQQLKLFSDRLQCKAEDDNGKICNRWMSYHQAEQDGMCNRCANMIWNYMRGDLEKVIFDE